jgi:hypothetical protein
LLVSQQEGFQYLQGEFVVTSEQKQRLQDIIKALMHYNSLISKLIDPLFADTNYLEQVMNLPDLLSGLLAQWAMLKHLAEEIASNSRLEKNMQKIEALILATALKTVEESVLELRVQSTQHIETLKVASSKNLLQQQPAQQAMEALSDLCQKLDTACTNEIGSLKQLCNADQPLIIQERVFPTLLIITGPISITSDKIHSPTGEIIFEFEPLGASSALCQMHKQHGIVGIRRIQITTLSTIERAALYNAALHLLALHPLNLAAKIVISPPAGGQKLLVQYHITREKTITIRFEQYAPLILPITFKTLDDAKQHLRTHYQIQAFLEEEVSWQLEELNQIANALSKLDKRPQDLITLAGCTLKRIKESKDDNPDAKTGGYYTPKDHTLTLTNVAFTSNERFYGIKNLCPYSHGVILHEMGHVIELHELRIQRKQDNKDIQLLEIKLKEGQELSQKYKKQYQGIKLVCEQEWEEFLKETEGAQANLLNALEQAKQEATEIYQGIQAAYEWAIDAYNNACDAAPEGNSQEARQFQAFLKPLYAMLEALKQARLSNRDLSLADLAQAQEAWMKVQAAETVLKQSLAGVEKEYAKLAYHARLLLRQVLEVARLYIPARQEENLRRASYRKRVKEDDLKAKDLTVQHTTVKSQAMEIWTSQQEVCFTIQQKILSISTDQIIKLDQENTSTLCLQKFIAFVKTNNIAPITLYAKQEWEKGNMSEFFAEAYHLFLNDPETLQIASLALYTWFEQSSYL